MKQQITYRLRCALLSVGFLLVLGGTSVAQQFQEYEVKAAFLCNFAKFVEWPESTFGNTMEPVVIGIYGEDPFGTAIDRIANNALVNNRKVLIKRFENTNEARDCHILYVGSTGELSIEEFLQKFSGKDILTVSENEGFCQAGGMINFSAKRMKYGFEINVNAANSVNLKISSKLLGLATIIE